MKISLIYKIYSSLKPVLTMFKNIKYYLIGITVLFLVAAVVTVNIQSKKINRLQTDNFRLEGNQFALLEDTKAQTTLFLKQKEITGQLLKERDSLAKALKIPPKQVEKISYNTITVHDSIDKPVLVFIAGQNFWKIKDKDKCFTWEADAFLLNDSLSVKRTDFSYQNKTTEIYYRKRPYHIWFIKYGKWIYKQKIDATCGNSTIKVFNFTK